MGNIGVLKNLSHALLLEKWSMEKVESMIELERPFGIEFIWIGLPNGGD